MSVVPQKQNVIYTITANDLSNQFAVVPVAWKQPFNGSAYAAFAVIEDLGGSPSTNYIGGDMHSITENGLNVIVFVVGGTAGDQIRVRVSAVQNPGFNLGTSRGFGNVFRIPHTLTQAEITNKSFSVTLNWNPQFNGTGQLFVFSSIEDTQATPSLNYLPGDIHNLTQSGCTINTGLVNDTPGTYTVGDVAIIHVLAIGGANTVKVDYALTQVDIDRSFAVIPVYWKSPHADAVNYAIWIGIEDPEVDPSAQADILLGDVHGVTTQSCNVVVYLFDILAVGKRLIVHAASF